MGKGVVDALKKEFDIEDSWVSYEIHPETPENGMRLEERFPKASMESMYDRLRMMGKPYGIEFGNLQILSNSRMALEASEFARDHGKFHEFHEAVFHAYFTDGKDIGDFDIVRSLAESVGLDKDELTEAVQKNQYLQRLADASEKGRMYGVSGTPTFIINNRYKIVGAQPLEAFRNALLQIEKE